ncbi:MAG: 30S ribosomal protein S12 methylthiotransferase RimO [Oscillospiraceae bacterium]|nr:30S ribosomal protein S12 methylthiotransferase RimO [Oscillospiraceae bacterium]
MNNTQTKIALVSLGCPKNQCDAELLLAKLAKAGYSFVQEPGEAQVVIINTCCFIQSAKEEAIEEIFEAVRRRDSGTPHKIIVTGCMAQRYKNQLAQELPEVDCFVELGRNDDIVKAVEVAVSGGAEKVFSGGEHNMEGERILSTMPHYAYLRISDGCDNNCTYCAIPTFRGAYRRREFASIVKEAQVLAEKGVQELILVAQDTSVYSELPKLLKTLAQIDKIKWIRMLYCYPQSILKDTEDALIEVIKSEPKVVKYLDLPIQHCNDEILTNMNRRITKAELTALIAKLRKQIPGLILRTTLMTGFPGETPKQFEELAEFAHEMRFEHLGCFAYSQEEGTPAAEREDQIDEGERVRRCEVIVEQQEMRVSEWSQGLIGHEFEIVCEGYDRYAEAFFGRTYMHAPEIDGLVYFTTSGELQIGDRLTVLITDVVDNNLVGEAKAGTV